MILNEVKVGDYYQINLPDHERHGQVVSVVHDSYVIGTEITRELCIVEDETNHRFVIRKLCLKPQREEDELLYEHGATGSTGIGHNPEQ